MSEFPQHCASQKISGPVTNSAQLDIDPVMNVCTLLILFWQCYKHGRERAREHVQQNVQQHF